MTGNEYAEAAMRTNDGLHETRLLMAIDKNRYFVDIPQLLNGCLGLAGEVGEFVDMVKKWVFHQKFDSSEHMKKEIGDVMWYVALICHAMGWSLDEIMQMNVEKLQARYPEGFDVEKSAHREKGDV